MFINLLAAIEADINLAQQKILHAGAPASANIEVQKLHEKKSKLATLAMEYVALENRYRELSGANSIY